MDQTSTDKIPITFIYLYNGNFRGRKLLGYFLCETWECGTFGAAKASNLQSFSPRKSYFSPICESFLPWKFPAMQYYSTVPILQQYISEVVLLSGPFQIGLGTRPISKVVVYGNSTLVCLLQEAAE